MDTQKLEYFLRLYENRNITHTAKELFITQSALTKMIQSLEEEYHCKLLTRSRKGVSFTREGELFVKLCRDILQLESRFRETIAAPENAVTGSLTIGLSLNYMNHHFPALLQRFVKAYPYVHLSVIDGHSERLYSDLLNRRLDAAVIRGEYKWSDTRILLDSEPFCLVSTHPLSQEMLKQEPYIGHRTDSDTMFHIDRWFFEHHLPLPDAAMWLSSIDACRDVVQKGTGWSILPKICLDTFTGNVKPIIYADGTPFLRSTYVLVSHGQSELPSMKAFLSALRAYHHLR
jgi:DNA-binding transcriptional LysR family regulator